MREEFPSLFQGLGNLGEDYCIKMREGVRPYALFAPRNVSIPLRSKVKEELDRMEKLGMITKVTQPTPWCAGMVVVPETYPIPPVDDTLAQLAGATVFSKVDANSGFWQIPLAKDSQLLTTFITPHRRCSLSH